MPDFRILDKDLDRLSNAQSAWVQAAGPLVRLGIAVIFVALAALALSGGGPPGPTAPGVLIAAAAAAGAFLALSIGANDVANALGPAVGAGAMPIGAGLAAVALMEVAGAVLAGSPVSHTLTQGILPAERMMTGTQPGIVMLAAMLAAACWITLATWAGAPVSTTHAIVGGIAGAGLALFGPGALNWPGIARIALGWVGTPIVSAVLAASVLAVLRAKVYRAADPRAAALRWMPWVVAATTGLLLLYALSVLPLPDWAVLALGAGGMGIALWDTRRRLAAPPDDGLSNAKQLYRLFNPALAVSALLMGFAHGANDSANIAGPLSIVAQAGALGSAGALSPWLLLLAGLGIALGAALFGRRLVHMVGSRITRLSPVRALCVSLATGVTVLTASHLGMPVSTTHIAVGGVFGVGFYREWEERRHHQARLAPLPAEERRRRRLVRRGHVVRTLAAWVVTVPIVAPLAALIALLIG